MNTVDFIRFFAMFTIASAGVTVVKERWPHSWIGRAYGAIT